MVSPELLRRYPFFAGFSHDELEMLANLGEPMKVVAGEYLFHEGDTLDTFYLTVQGAVAAVMELTDRQTPHALSDQLVGRMRTRDVVVSTVGPGEVLAWSALVPPYLATSNAKTLTDCELVMFDAVELRHIFKADCKFGYRMLEKVAGVARERLRDMRLESLAQKAI